jgi:hypothetical protein
LAGRVHVELDEVVVRIGDEERLAHQEVERKVHLDAAVEVRVDGRQLGERSLDKTVASPYRADRPYVPLDPIITGGRIEDFNRAVADVLASEVPARLVFEF